MPRTAKQEKEIREAIELLTRTFGITLKPAGGNTFDVPLPDLQLRVEIAMKVHHQASKEDEAYFKEIALGRLEDPDHAWNDHCACLVRSRGHYFSNSTTGCSLPVVGVVVHRPRILPSLQLADKPDYHYSFRCRIHINQKDSDATSVVYRSTFSSGALKAARTRRAEAIAFREKWKAMPEEQRIEMDARALERTSDADAIRAQREPSPPIP